MSSMANVIYYKCLLTSTYLSIDASVFFMLLGALLIRDDALVGTTWSLVLDIILGFIVMSSFAVALVLFGDILINKRAVDAPNSTTFLSPEKDDEEDEVEEDCIIYDNDDGNIEIVRRELATRESPSGSNPSAATNRPSADRNKTQQPRGGKSHTQPGTPTSSVNNGSTINLLSRTQPNTPLHHEVDSTIPTVAVHTPADYLRSSVVRPHPKVVIDDVVDDDDEMMSPSGVEALAIWDTLDDVNISNRSASDAPLGGAKSTTAFSAIRGSPSGSNPTSRRNPNARGNPTAGTSRPSTDRNKTQQPRERISRTQPGTPTSPSPINFPWINRLSSTQPNSPNVNGKPTASTLLVGSIGNSSNKVYASNDVMMSRSQDFLSGLLRHQPHSSGSPFDLESKGEVSELDGIDEEYDAVAAADLDINNNSNSKSNSNSNEVFRYDEEQNDMMSVNSVEEELSEKPPEKIKTILSENDLLVLLDKMKKEI